MASHKSQKSAGHSQEHDDDELWIVSYADLMTLLFGFFVILYSFSTLDEKKFENVSKTVAEAFKGKEQDKKEDDSNLTEERRQLRALQFLVTMLGLGQSMDEAVSKIENLATTETADQAAKKILQAKSGLLDELGGTISDAKKKGEPPTVSIILPEKMLFGSGEAQLMPEARAKVLQLASSLKSIPALTSIEVEGHTDSRPLPKTSLYRDNFVLSSLRAASVVEELVKGGVNEKIFTIKGYAHLKPLVPEKDAQGKDLPENRSRNRRVHILIRKGER